MRAPDSVKQQLREKIDRERQDAVVDIWPEHWHAVNVFLSMGTQWRLELGMRGPVYFGLDMAASGPALREHRRIKHALPLDRLMPLLRRFEREAIKARNES